MKAAFLAALLSLLSAASVDGFVVGIGCSMRSAARASAVKVSMSASPKTRSAFLEQGALGFVGALALTQPASAAKYFGDTNDYPEVVKPEDAVKDSEVLSSPSVKKGIEKIKQYKTAVADLGAQLSKDDQADLRAKIKSTFNFSQLRTVLNDTNAVFDEDTQKGTDRLIRNIIQDAIEFGDASRMKEGIPRSKRKVEIMKKKLNKLEKSFDDLLAFF